MTRVIRPSRRPRTFIAGMIGMIMSKKRNEIQGINVIGFVVVGTLMILIFSVSSQRCLLTQENHLTEICYLN